MNNSLFEYESPCYYIAIPFKELVGPNKEENYFYDFIAYAHCEDETPIRCGNKIITTTILTVFEDYALTFRRIDNALEWCDNHLEEIKHKIEEEVPGHFDWDKTAIVKKEYTVIPLGNP